MLTQHTWSFQSRLIAVFIGLFLIFIWVLVFFSVTVLKSQFEQVLADQQFAATQRFAAELEDNLTDRTQGLARIAENFPDDLQSDALNDFLSEKKTIHGLFSAGLFVIGLDGKSIAESPLVAGRKDIYYGDRDYFLNVVASRKSWIGIPIIGRALKRPLLPIAVPVFDGSGHLRAVMVGLTDLMVDNFIAAHSDPSMSGKGEFLVVSARDKMIIAATDQQRVLSAAPPQGVNPMFDRFLAGFEGSGIAFGSAGNAQLFSGKYLPMAQWIVIAALPTEVAFGPVKLMQNYLYVIAFMMTLVAIFIVQWMARRLLAPLEHASNAMQEMTDGKTALVALPVKRMDEIGVMIGNFNRLAEERQRYEAALAESEKRFRMLVESAPDAIFVQVESRFAYVNLAAVHLFGAASKKQLLGQPVAARLHADGSMSAEESNRSLQSASSALLERKYLQMDGKAVDVEVTSVPFHYQQADGVLIFARDITERKRAHRVIRESDARYRSLFENMLEGFAYCRVLYEHGQAQDFICLDVNPAFERLTKVSNIVGKKISSIMPAMRQDNGQLFDLFVRVASGGRPERIETRVVPLARWYAISVYNVSEGYFIVFFNDVTAIKEGEAVLRESEQRIHGIATNTPGMMFQCVLPAGSEAPQFSYVSEGAMLLLALTSDQILSDCNAITQQLSEQDRPAFHDSLRHSALSMEGWNWEGTTVLIDGEQKWINGRATPRLSGAGDVIWEGVMLNITESKRSEEALRQSGQLLRDLSAHMESVREEERKRIAREVHDELGQALTVLRMDVSLLRLHFGGQSPQLMERILAMKEGVDRTIQIMRHVTSTLRPVALDLGLIAGLEWLVEEFTRHAGIHCQLNASGCEEVVLDDGRATALFRIVQESLTNVIKHADASTVVVSIRVAENHSVCVEISDNGKGFVPESGRKAGSFGLIGMRERALMLHGEVDIDSTPGNGTRVEVCIPLAQQ